ncbi:hypothetical protein [Amycolatopsis sp. 195334CR]|uniref:hypothetical protein n=1 Tax=Amycolatopsis sp. 195334CR TaxID=2814588 RepID=UPI001A8C59B8|nr:hypothetical protein [Amycolatopsis sp. 195334CR]MBN6033651.1 hypothetical protein [Amycolatopsis sp. 195334CR]
MRILLLLPLFIGLVCTAFWVAGGLSGDDEFAWLNGWLAGPILVLASLPFAFLRGLSGAFGGVPREFRDAPIGIGTVTGVARTGLSVNDHPELEIQLRVDTPDGRSFPASARQIVDLTDLAAVQPNATLPVRYLPDGRVALATDAALPELQAALNRVQVAKGWMTPNQLRIAEQGVDARAVVLAMTPTGHTADGRSEVTLGLRITRGDGTTFDLTQEKKLPPSAVGQVQPGMVVRVKYLPHDESEVALVTSLAG